MAQKVYEGLFLLDSNRYARDPGGVSKQIDKIIEECGGEMLASRLWAEQKLAYQIEGHRKGTYWLTYFRLDTQKQDELNRMCQLNDNILRNLVLSVDDRLVETLVAHATGVATKPEAEEEAKEAPAAEAEATAAVAGDAAKE